MAGPFRQAGEKPKKRRKESRTRKAWKERKAADKKKRREEERREEKSRAKNIICFILPVKPACWSISQSVESVLPILSNSRDVPAWAIASGIWTHFILYFYFPHC